LYSRNYYLETRTIELLELDLDTKLSTKTLENLCIRKTELIDRAFQSITLVFDYRDGWRGNMLDKDKTFE